MGILTACLDKVYEVWPAVKAGFEGKMDAPWEEKISIGRNLADQTTQSFLAFLSPDTFYKSKIGRDLVEGVADTVNAAGDKVPGHAGLLGADLQSKLLASKFVERNKNLLSMI